MTDLAHGTPSAYFSGCGCPSCKAAGHKYRSEGTYHAFLEGRTKTPPLFLPGDRSTPYDPDDPRHGKLSAYTRGCRCPWCIIAGEDHRAHAKLGLKLPQGYNARNK